MAAVETVAEVTQALAEDIASASDPEGWTYSESDVQQATDWATDSEPQSWPRPRLPRH